MREIMDWVIFAVLVVCGIRDWKKREIPIWWLVVASVLVVAGVLIWGRNMWISRMVGVFVGIFFLFVSKYSKEAIGYGDSWLILLLGLYLGSLRALQVLFFAAVAAGIGGLFFLWKRKWKRDIAIPFVPYMALAYLGVLFL